MQCGTRVVANPTHELNQVQGAIKPPSFFNTGNHAASCMYGRIASPAHGYQPPLFRATTATAEDSKLKLWLRLESWHCPPFFVRCVFGVEHFLLFIREPPTRARGRASNPPRAAHASTRTGKQSAFAHDRAGWRASRAGGLRCCGCSDSGKSSPYLSGNVGCHGPPGAPPRSGVPRAPRCSLLPRCLPTRLPKCD